MLQRDKDSGLGDSEGEPKRIEETESSKQFRLSMAVAVSAEGGVE
jgi:hypothetical protein